MKSNNQRPKETKQDPEFTAKQLRRPSGDFAMEVGQKMNQVNKPLYDLTFEVLELQENDHILEIGFGNGKFFKDLFSIKNKIQVKAIDFSEEMVEAAREENQEALSSGILDIKLGSSEAIPFPDQSFDKVFCNMVIYFWDQPEKHLKEVRRVLKPDGTFYTGIRTRESMRVFPFIEYGFNHLFNEGVGRNSESKWIFI
ncbi:class I SAM-dependent methyltransferase [Aliifodinibius salicampi]|uniref:Class I SAM-dependent methyltransferase n=1 Tax=Fodinibius salicampi TaxID=1920655 RepID=A0ABT3PTY7_9BACT|nr:class I SAM-dependent methyltransferase [Fodinibius salicampi]MCW9711307.1 class I SAM-dependent methyltransferase [Fodinibius salicampi]